MNLERGVFITFEGGEGSGKSTQVKKLAENLGERGYNVVLTREPGGTAEAEKIRALLVQNEGLHWSPIEECLLLYAARSHHVRTLIQPALKSGKIVISDRFTDSTRAYQGYGFGLRKDKIETIHKLTLNEFEPDLTFLLDIPADKGLKRSKNRLINAQSNEDKYEALDIEFHEKLRTGFLEMAENDPERFRVIDALCTVDEIADKIIDEALEKVIHQ